MVLNAQFRSKTTSKITNRLWVFVDTKKKIVGLPAAGIPPAGASHPRELLPWVGTHGSNHPREESRG